MYCHFEQNLGYIKVKVREEDISMVLDEMNEMLSNNFKDCIPKNPELAGNIEHEYLITKSSKQIEKLVMPLCDIYDRGYRYNKYIGILDKNYPFMLADPWINFQRKGEFNPVHSHSGFYSFVIWLKIPYSVEDELKNKSSVNSNCNYPGHFGFHYTDTLGQLNTKYLVCDKQTEHTLLFFPSKMNHSVNPFFTSDDYRITVSGNILVNPN